VSRLSYSSRASQTHGTKTGIRIASFLLREMVFSSTEIAGMMVEGDEVLSFKPGFSLALRGVFGLRRWNSYVNDRVITT